MLVPSQVWRQGRGEARATERDPDLCWPGDPKSLPATTANCSCWFHNTTFQSCPLIQLSATVSNPQHPHTLSQATP